MRITINLRNGFYYTGEIISEDKDFVTMRDKFGKLVTINKMDIVTRMEDDDGN